MNCYQQMADRYGRKWFLFNHYRKMRNAFIKYKRGVHGDLLIAFLDSQQRYTCEMRRAIRAMRQINEQ
jgi:hypothetical protein